MAEEFLTKREFDGYTTAMRGEIGRVLEQLSAVSVKIDGLVNIRIDEARMMGQITESIRAINDRLERHEAEEKLMRAELDQVKDSKAKWWAQLSLIVLAAVMGAFLARFFK